VEAQVAAFADDIAYDAHDIDDGLRAGCSASTISPKSRFRAIIADIGQPFRRSMTAASCTNSSAG
jgi:dGTPase